MSRKTKRVQDKVKHTSISGSQQWFRDVDKLATQRRMSRSHLVRSIIDKELIAAGYLPDR